MVRSLSHGLAGCCEGLVCNNWELTAAPPVNDLLPGMTRTPLLEPGMIAGGLPGSLWGSTSSLELGIMVGFDCFCVNQTQLNNKPSEEQMAAMRSTFMLAGYQTGRDRVDSKVALLLCNKGPVPQEQGNFNPRT